MLIRVVGEDCRPEWVDAENYRRIDPPLGNREETLSVTGLTREEVAAGAMMVMNRRDLGLLAPGTLEKMPAAFDTPIGNGIMDELAEQDSKGFVIIHKMDDGTYRILSAGLTREEIHCAIAAAYERERLCMMDLWTTEPAKGPPPATGSE